MRDGIAITTQSVNRVTLFRTPRRTPKKGAEKTSPPRIMVCPSGLARSAYARRNSDYYAKR